MALWPPYSRMYRSWPRQPFLFCWNSSAGAFVFRGLLPAVNALLLACLYHELAFCAAVVLLIGGGVSMQVMYNQDRHGMPLKYDELPKPAVQSLNLLK